MTELTPPQPPTSPSPVPEQARGQASNSLSADALGALGAQVDVLMGQNMALTEAMREVLLRLDALSRDNQALADAMADAMARFSAPSRSAGPPSSLQAPSANPLFEEPPAPPAGTPDSGGPPDDGPAVATAAMQDSLVSGDLFDASWWHPDTLLVGPGATGAGQFRLTATGDSFDSLRTQVALDRSVEALRATVLLQKSSAPDAQVFGIRFIVQEREGADPVKHDLCVHPGDGSLFATSETGAPDGIAVERPGHWELSLFCRAPEMGSQVVLVLFPAIGGTAGDFKPGSLGANEIGGVRLEPISPDQLPALNGGA